MHLLARCYILTGLFFLSQLGGSRAASLDKKEGFLEIQTYIETLLERILVIAQKFYDKLKCVPDEVPATLMEIIKHTVNCVDQLEKKLQDQILPQQTHMTLVDKCFTFGEKQVMTLMQSLDPDEGYCPDNMTDKFLQINITTSFTKLFNIKITKGMLVTKESVSAVVNAPTENLTAEPPSFGVDLDGQQDGDLSRKVVRARAALGQVTRALGQLSREGRRNK